MANPRQFGDVISGNCRPLQELSTDARAFVVGAKALGGTTSEVAEAIGCHASTIRRTIQRLNTTETTQSRRRSGAPKKLSARDKRALLRIARASLEINYRDLQARAGTNVHPRTIQRLLKEYNITNWIAKKRPILAPIHAQQRLVFALAHQHWGYTEWSQVIWSDECSLERGSGKDRKWVFRTPEQNGTTT